MGLLTGGTYLYKTFKTNLVKGLVGLFCVLVNIPALGWVLKTQDDIERRAYVRIYNKTGIDLKELTIENSDNKRLIKTLDKEDSKTRFFCPKYLNGEFDSSPIVDQVRLTIKTDNEKKIIEVPTIYKGECVEVIIDEQFGVKLKRQFED